MNRDEYKKQRNCRFSVVKRHLIYAFFVRKITYPKRPSWPAVHVCNCDRKLTINSQMKFIGGSNFDPDTPFRSLTCGIQNSAVTNILQRQGQVVCVGAVVVNFRTRLQECIACQADQLRGVCFKKWKRNVNPLWTASNMFHLKTQFVPRSKHVPSRL
jgi:hypothetical protein